MVPRSSGFDVRWLRHPEMPQKVPVETVILHHAEVPAAAAALPVERWLAALPAARAERLRRLGDDGARLASLLGLALLASAAAAAGYGPPPWAALQFDEGRKPLWPGGPAFSVSHAAGRVGCAVAARGSVIGFDLERQQAVAASDLRLVATSREREAMAAGRLSASRLWVAKEAVLKAAGGSVREAGAVQIEPPTGHLHGVSYHLQWLEPVPRVDGAVATGQTARLLVADCDGVALLTAGPS